VPDSRDQHRGRSEPLVVSRDDFKFCKQLAAGVFSSDSANPDGISPNGLTGESAKWVPAATDAAAARRGLSTEVAAEGSGSTSTSGASSDHGESGSHGHHPHEALLFLFNGLLIGTAIMHASVHIKGLQQTVALFVSGMLVSLVMEGMELKSHIGVFGSSYDMWMGIDPHLLLFCLLPALLAGDAMTIDTGVAQHVAYQCLYLAGPGVLVNALVVSAFLSVYLNWSFLLSMVLGSILCATDPVAVVALLKKLGASPALTVQIQGESLLNDGTSIVLYMICYDMLSGRDYDWSDMIKFLVQTAMMAWALGMFIGYFFFSWIRGSGNRLCHESSMIQISLTICCAYWSYIMAELVLGISGVLATVASSLVLAHHMWPHVVAPDSLEHVWHTIESLGNCIIFFVAGALTGNAMVKIEPMDYLHLLVIYVVLIVVRGAMIFGSLPVLSRLNSDRIPVTPAEAAVMTWSGLRGAVGLALALQVRIDRAPDGSGEFMISEEDGYRVLFFTSGIALLTTVINALTAPMLVHKLGIAALPEAQLYLLKMLTKQLVNLSQDMSNPPEVTDGLKVMLHDIEHDITSQKVNSRGPRTNRVLPSGLPEAELEGIERNQNLVTRLREAEAVYEEDSKGGKLGHFTVHNKGGAVHKGVGEDSLLGKVDDLCLLLSDTGIDDGMAKVVNRAFLGMVLRHYWKQTACSDLRAGSDEADILFTSIQVALSPLSTNLVDFSYVRRRLRQKAMEQTGDWWKVFPEESTEIMGRQNSLQSHQRPKVRASLFSTQEDLSNLPLIHRIVRSAYFNIGMAVAILVNAIWVAIEEGTVTEENAGHIGWLLCEAFFCGLFTVEATLKLCSLRWRYFKDKSNVFDFILVILGLLGLVLSSVEYHQRSQGQSEMVELTSIIRISRVLRVLRFLRVFRLFHARLSADKDVSLELANHMLLIATLMSFVSAHLSSQKMLIKYFGRGSLGGDTGEAEVARCVIQSQIFVYKAIDMAQSEQKAMGEEDQVLLQELKWVYERKEITEDLEEFVMDAFHNGAISNMEAASIVHPMQQQISNCLVLLSDTTDGIVDRGVLHSGRTMSNKKDGPVNSVSVNTQSSEMSGNSDSGLHASHSEPKPAL